MSKASDTWSNLIQSDKTANAPEGPSAWDKVASTLSGVGNFASGFAFEQLHTAGQDLVSRVLLQESFSPQDAAKEPEREPDRAPEKDDGLDR